MPSDGPSLVLIAGPNGAGKTTAAPAILTGSLKVTEFVNADVIAQGLSGFQPERAALQAGRVLLERLHRLAVERIDFAFETTLASRSFVPWITELIGKGYFFHLVFLSLPSAEMAVERVAGRIRQGGHAVPEEVVRRRYRSGLRNFFHLYQPLTETWRIYDNTNRLGPRLIAAGSGQILETVRDPVAWDRACAEERE